MSRVPTTIRWGRSNKWLRSMTGSDLKDLRAWSAEVPTSESSRSCILWVENCSRNLSLPPMVNPLASTLLSFTFKMNNWGSSLKQPRRWSRNISLLNYDFFISYHFFYNLSYHLIQLRVVGLSMGSLLKEWFRRQNKEYILESLNLPIYIERISHKWVNISIRPLKTSLILFILFIFWKRKRK